MEDEKSSFKIFYFLFYSNHKITQIFTRNLFLKRKVLPKELICFSFSTGNFLFVKRKRGSSLFCMGNSISLLSAEADYMRGMLNVESP